MLRKMLSQKKTWFGALLVIGGAFVLCACNGGEVAFRVKGGSVSAPGFLAAAAEAVGSIPGFEWIKIAAGALGILGGGTLITKSAIKAHDAAPFTAEDVASIEAAKAAAKPEAPKA